VVVLSFEDYKKITKPKIDLVAFLKNSPLAEIELDILRNGELLVLHQVIFQFLFLFHQTLRH
jgi:hypothetical protein